MPLNIGESRNINGVLNNNNAEGIKERSETDETNDRDDFYSVGAIEW